MKKSKAISWLLILINCFYAGLTSEVIFGFRVFDFLIVAALLISLDKKTALNKDELAIIWLLLIVLIYGFYIGVYNENKFMLSGFSEFFIFILTIFTTMRLSNHIGIDEVQKIFHISIFFVIFIYIALFFIEPLQYYYASVDHLQSMTDQDGRIHGPNPIFISLLFALLSTMKHNYLKNSFLFFFFIVFVYLVTQTRQLLVIMGLIYLFSALINDHKKITFPILISSILIVLFYVSALETGAYNRFLKIFNPFDDTSFLYRIYSNTEFLKQFFSLDHSEIIFGMGFGATMDLNLGSYIGVVRFVLLDNSILTIMMRSGLLGLFIFIFIIINQIVKLPHKLQFLAWIPLIFGGMLSAHLLTNPLYILGFMFHISFLKRIMNNEKNYIFDN